MRIKNQLSCCRQVPDDDFGEKMIPDANGKRQLAQSMFSFLLFMQSEGLSGAFEIENSMHLKQLFLTPSLGTQRAGMVRGRRNGSKVTVTYKGATLCIDTIN